MSENIQSISRGTFTIGQTSATNFVAGPGIKIDEPSAGTVRIGNDETVLWSGAADTKTSGTLTDSIWNYERVKMYINLFQGGDYITEISPTGTSPGTATRSFITYGPRGNNDCAFDMCKWIFSDTGFSAVSAKTFHSTWTATAITVENNQPAALGYCHKIVGINRKEV